MKKCTFIFSSPGACDALFVSKSKDPCQSIITDQALTPDFICSDGWTRAIGANNQWAEAGPAPRRARRTYASERIGVIAGHPGMSVLQQLLKLPLDPARRLYKRFSVPPSCNTSTPKAAASGNETYPAANPMPTLYFRLSWQAGHHMLRIHDNSRTFICGNVYHNNLNLAQSLTSLRQVGVQFDSETQSAAALMHFAWHI